MPDVPTQRQLSKEVRDYFLSDDVFAQYERIAGDYGLNQEEAVSSLSALVYQFVAGVFPLDTLLRKIQMEFLLTTPRAQELLSAVFLYVVSAVADQVSGLSQALVDWKSSAPQEEKMTPRAFIRLYLSSIPDRLDPVEEHRLENILSLYLQGVRSREETVAFLQRPHKLGGMEMEQDDAIEMLAEFELRKQAVVFSDEIEPPTPSTVSTPPAVSIPSAPALDVFSSDDAEEVAHHAQKDASPSSNTISLSADELLARICQNDAFVFSDPQKQKRCQEIVSARVRDVRDAFQTRALLEQSIDQGGLGIHGLQLAQMVEQIEQVVDAQQRESQKNLEQERTASSEQKKQKQQIQDQLRIKEEQVLAKRYVQTTGQLPTEPVAPAAPPLARASAAFSPQAQIEKQEARVDAQKVRAIVQKAASAQPLPTPPPAPRGRVQDIQMSHRLSGPLEELGSMDLTAFRRLSHEPAQAASRLMDLVGLLENQSYEKRVEGIKMLKRSPLMHVYASVTQKALLGGKSVDEVLSQDLQGLKLAEYQALMEVNASLRF
ncbi:hypothetical protein HZA85_00550 [Candidatus Uhrbacteria bacterium]|nr:hypothetical protein [Candidatus Uhrbacteria bacterium]